VAGTRWLLGLASIAIVGVTAYLLLAGEADPPRGHSAHEAAKARWLAVEESAVTGIPKAHLLAISGLQGRSERRVSGDCVTYVGTFRRRWDFAQLPMDDRRGGPVEPLLALAQAQHARLARSGFDAMSATWTTLGQEGHERVVPGDDPWMPRPPSPPPPLPEGHRSPPRRGVVRVEVSHQSDSGGGGGSRNVDLNAPVIVHSRTYVVPRSGVTLFVRNTYDQQERIVESEFAYSDRTLHGAEYLTGSYIVGREPGRYSVSERIILPDPR
jgi:hypothetical protein